MANASVIVCNQVAQDNDSGQFVLVGPFDSFQSPIYPVRADFYAFAKVWGVPAGPAKVALRLVDAASGKVIEEAGEHSYTSTGPEGVHTAISYFANTTIPKSGNYELRAYMGNQVVGTIPLKATSLAQ